MAEIDDLLFVGFNSRVAALDRHTGDLVWSWKSPQGSGYVALLLDGGLLFASVQGYTYCLDPQTGVAWWQNDLKGMGIGVPCLATSRGNTGAATAVAAEAQQSESSPHAPDPSGA